MRVCARFLPLVWMAAAAPCLPTAAATQDRAPRRLPPIAEPTAPVLPHSAAPLAAALQYRATWPGDAPSTEAAVLVASSGEANPDRASELERRLSALEARQQAVDEPDDGQRVQYPTFRIRGWIAAEQLMVEDTPLSGPLENFSGFRSIRLGADGFIAESIRYVLELEVASNQGVINNTVNPFDSIRLKDVFVEFQQLPWLGYFRVGHFKEPMGLEELIRDRFKVFVDRSTVTAVFAPKRNFGAMIYDSVGEDEYLSWFIGVFNADSTEDEMGYQGDSNDLALTMRAAWLPYFDQSEPGRYLVHVGGAVSARRTVNPVVDNGNFQPTIELGRYRSGLIAVLNNGEEFMLYNTELAWAHGPFAAQHEFYILNTSNTTGVVFWGSYLELSYFLTGENRSYNKRDKVFDRTFPFQNFMAFRTGEGIARGWGAWQVSGRASFVDLETNGQLQPGAVLGTQLNLSANLHWYLNPNCHLVATYVHPIATPSSGAPASVANDFGVRFQVDW